VRGGKAAGDLPRFAQEERDKERGVNPDAALPLRSIALHASAVETPGGALIFLGHAGAGKSTICRLLAGGFPPLADDAVYLFRPGEGNGGWRVADGSGRAFAGPLSEQKQAGLEGPPLRAILRLYQASASRLERIGPRQTCRHLTDALFEIAWPVRAAAGTKRGMFCTVAQVARQHPGWRLRFREDDGTSELVCSTFA
jgi:energy-coupling factor transporter ATP-binding protein EcfA2